MALLQEQMRLQGLQKKTEHQYKLEDLGITEKGKDKRSITMAGGKKEAKAEQVAIDADNRDTALSEKLSDSPDAKSVGTASALTAALRRYRALLENAGTSVLGGTPFADAKQREIDSAYADYTALAKDEKILGQLTASDRQIIKDTVDANTGYVWLADQFTGTGVDSIKKQIDGALQRLAVSGQNKISRLRKVAGKDKNPRTHAYIDTLESEIGRANGMTTDEDLAISTFKEQTRALAAEREKKKKEAAKGGTP